MQGYTDAEIIDAYARVGVEAGRVVLVRSDLGRLLGYQDPRKEAVLEAHYRALTDLLGPAGTLVVPTGNLSLCNTDIPFNLDTTPGWRLGMFSEYVRTRAGARRSFHPFVSHAAIGRLAGEITSNVSRNAYGPESSKARLIDMDALFVSVGAHPRRTCSVVHHAEQVMGVPYRYTKEFMHPVERESEITVEPFYLHVTNRDCEIDRDDNVKIVDNFLKKHRFEEHKLGRGTIYSCSLREFYESCVESFRDDIYVWLRNPPKTRPYRR